MAATATVRKRNSGLNRIARREAITGYLFIAPYLIVTAIFTVGLLVYAFYVSMTSLGETFSRRSEFIGFQNYWTALTNADFQRSLYNAFWFSLIVTITQTAGAILLAVVLNARLVGLRIFRTLFYAPSVASSVVISMIFLWLYIRTGFINYFLGLLGLPNDTAWLQTPDGLFLVLGRLFNPELTIANPYLQGPSIAWLALMAMNIFTTIPTFMLMFLAALQDIPQHLYEAAELDGATGWRSFWHITLPMLRPTVVLVLVLSTIGTLQVFDQVAIMTAGGPLKTTLTPAFLIYIKTLGDNTRAEAGLAAAMAFILAAIIVAITYLQRRLIESGSEQY